MSKTNEQQEDLLKEKLIEIVRYDSKRDNLGDLQSSILTAYEASREFFDRDVGGIKVNFFYTREELDQARGCKSPDWVVGFTDGGKNVGIFSPKVFSEVSPHPSLDFPYVLTHEIAHVFTSEVFKLKLPQWLREGLAGYVAKQYQTRSISKDKLCSFDLMNKDWRNNGNYPQAYLFTKYLVDQFGKEVFMAFLSSLEETSTPEDFAGKFKDSFKTSFGDVERSWIETLN